MKTKSSQFQSKRKRTGGINNCGCCVTFAEWKLWVMISENLSFHKQKFSLPNHLIRCEVEEFIGVDPR